MTATPYIVRHRAWLPVIGMVLFCSMGLAHAETAGAPANASATSPVGIAPGSAEELFRQLAKLEGLEATFVETKKMALLRAPLESRGRLYYLQPGYLLREVEAPSPSRVLITPSTLELHAADTKRSIDLSARPDVKLFVESFTKVLAGDHQALAKGFDIRFTPNVAAGGTAAASAAKGTRPNTGWKLVLTPKAAPLNQLIRQLELTGTGYAVERIGVQETKGDSSEIVLTVKSVRRVYSSEEKRRLFGLADSATKTHP